MGGQNGHLVMNSEPPILTDDKLDSDSVAEEDQKGEQCPDVHDE